MLKSDMHRFAYAFGFLLGFFILSNARHTVFISRSGKKTYLPSPQADVCMTRSCVTAAADILNSLDETVNPCDDFYSFACGGWIKRQEVSEDQEERSIFVDTSDELDRRLRDIIESDYTTSDPSYVKKIKDYYKTCIDLDTIEKQGSEPLKKMLRILGGGWPVVEGSQWDESSFDWVDSLISFRKLGYDFKILFNMDVNPDPKNDTVNSIVINTPFIARLRTANLSLGMNDPQIAAYYELMVKAAKLLGANESTAEMELLEALKFEIAIIELMRADQIKNSRSMTVNTIADLQKESPKVPWLKIINGLLLTEQVYEDEKIINKKPDFLVKLADLITSTEKRVIANYMLWRALLEYKGYLWKEWMDPEEDGNFFEKSQRRKFCLLLMKTRMNTGLSAYYVRKYVSEESKDEVMMILNYVHKEFLNILNENQWMDETTRKKAEKKAKAIKMYVGYPEELLNDTLITKEYENLKISTDSFLENVLAIQRWKTDERLTKFRKMSDTEKLNLKYKDVLSINSQYFPFENSLKVPAGVLHNPMFDKDRPKYMNFARVGFTMGHEITHGFDNMGRKFNEDGKMVEWWDKESDEKFLKKTKCIVDQYSNYTTSLGTKLNGEMKKDENIADNGGLKEAYLAYRSWTKNHGIEPLLPGVKYNQDQLFWLSAANMWCSKLHPSRLRWMIYYSDHTPPKYRVIGSMSNVPQFSTDFKCSSDAPMNRKDKCEVW